MANEITPGQTQPVPSQIAGADSSASSTNSPSFLIGQANIQGVLVKNRRLLLIVTSCLMLLGFIGLVLWSAEPPYQAVFANISEQKAALVVEALQKEHIPYRLESGGTILIPADQIYAVRLKLAGQGIMPENGTGFELFDKNTPFGISNFAQKINLQRALQGELARTISVLPQVSAARVHLVLPKESAFIEHQRKASASVMLQLSGGHHLPKQAILAIQNLVSASVPNLKREDVTIVDSAGNLLSSNEEQTAMDAGQGYQEYQMRFEQRLEERLTGMLEQVVGVGQAVVRVTAEIDREQVEQNNQRYNPDEAVLRKQKIIEESRQASDGIASGVPGMASNVPNTTSNKPKASMDITTQPPSEAAKRTERISSFEISSTTEKRIIPAGGINKLSVAVIVGGSFKEENGKSVFVPRSQQELKSIQGLVERAMGYNEDRGDSLAIQSLPLVDISSHEDAAALEAAERKTLYLELARYGVAGLALLLLTWFVLRPMAKRLSAQQTINHEMDLASSSKALAIPENTVAHLEWQNTAKELVAEDPNLAARILHQWTQQS